MGKTPECKHCGQPIKFVHANGRWKPTDPQTGQRHKCEADRTCEQCGVEFRGAPWMKLCSLCWDNENLDKNRVHRGREPAPKPRSKPERLEEDWDDGKAPF